MKNRSLTALLRAIEIVLVKNHILSFRLQTRNIAQQQRMPQRGKGTGQEKKKKLKENVASPKETVFQNMKMRHVGHKKTCDSCNASKISFHDTPYKQK